MAYTPDFINYYSVVKVLRRGLDRPVTYLETRAKLASGFFVGPGGQSKPTSGHPVASKIRTSAHRHRPQP